MRDVKIFFRKSDDYRVYPVSGIWGGITAQGMLACDFFVEKVDTPESVNVSMDDESGQVQEVSRFPAEPYVTREVLMGIMVRPEVARSIGQWFISKADEFDRNVSKFRH